MNLYDQKDKNIRKTWMLMIIFVSVVVGIAWVFSYTLGNQMIFVWALIVSLFMNVISYWYSDSIVLSISNAHPINTDTAEGKRIYRLLENLAITAGLPVPKLYIIQDSAMNAFATGRDPEHSAIALTTGIIDRLEQIELEGVIAHELSHIGNRDTLIQTISVVLVGLVALLSDWFIRISFWGGGRKNNNDDSRLGLILGIVAIVLAILAPIFVQLLHFAISRKREFLADASGALLTRYPEGLASALDKISQDTEPLEVANRATAHLFISNPFKGGGMSDWMSTHPPTPKRIEALRGIKIN
ncbi:MAG: M48 family metallopeptidase [Candidatus Paceibacterota bacterium]